MGLVEELGMEVGDGGGDLVRCCGEERLPNGDKKTEGLSLYHQSSPKKAFC